MYIRILLLNTGVTVSIQTWDEINCRYVYKVNNRLSIYKLAVTIVFVTCSSRWAELGPVYIDSLDDKGNGILWAWTWRKSFIIIFISSLKIGTGKAVMMEGGEPVFWEFRYTSKLLKVVVLIALAFKHLFYTQKTPKRITKLTRVNQTQVRHSFGWLFKL